MGTRYWNIGGYFNRPDGTSFSASYRQLQPLGSKVVQGSIGYMFSPKYQLTYSASIDLGLNTSLSHNLGITRTGTDLTWSFGFSYNQLVNNFGINFIVVPNLLASRGLANSPVALNGQGGTGQVLGR